MMSLLILFVVSSFFFFNDTATTEIYTLSLHDALPIYRALRLPGYPASARARGHRYAAGRERSGLVDRKSTRRNSSHVAISYAVVCLKSKNDYCEISSQQRYVPP